MKKIQRFKKRKHLFSRKNNKKLNSKYKYKYLIKAFIIFLYLFFLFRFDVKTKTKEQIEIFNINQFFNATINNNSILIFEKGGGHHECTPGFTKYFLDFGYNVDIIIIEKGYESFIYFEPTKKIRFFILDDNKYYTTDNYIVKFREIFEKYLAILVETMTPDINYFYEKANLLKGKNSIFVYHYYPEMSYIDFQNKIRSWTLLNFTDKALGVNPHYFGKIKPRDKNKITRFFIVSTGQRNYEPLISSTEKLKNENFEFQIIVTGTNTALSNSIIPDSIKDKFLFNLFVSYLDLMKIVETIDFIIIPLYTNIPRDNTYNNGRATGSAQLAYGFLKPCLINIDFAGTYRMNNKNSFIFNETYSLYFVMRDAIMINNKEYKKKQYNMKIVADQIYEFSKKNVKTTIEYILNN